MKVLVPSILVAASLFVAAPLNALAAEATATPAPSSGHVLLARSDLFIPTVESTASATVPEGFDSGKRDARLAVAKSPEALRRYIDRTRMVYGLTYEAFAPNK